MEVESHTGRPPLYITRIASFVSVGLLAGLTLAAVPNVELVTAVCFCAGFLLGPAAGFLTGGLTEALFAGFHPMGSSLGLLLLAQVIGMSLAGLLGSLAAFIGRQKSGSRFFTVIVGAGILSTLIFDLLTNLAFPIMAGFSYTQFLVTMVAAIPFAAIHLISNILVFSLIVVPLLPKLQKVMGNV